MVHVADRFERIISTILLFFAMVFITYQVASLGWNTVQSFAKRFKEVGLEYAPAYGRDISILFFNVLLTLEIMQTIRVFAEDHVIKVRVILIVCLIAVGRKILAMGETSHDPLADLASAGLILSLGISYFLVTRPGQHGKGSKEEQDGKES